MNTTRVAVLRGGPSQEYEISMKTGAAVSNALRARGIHVKDVVVTQAADWIVDGMVRQPAQALADVDVAFIALHGEYGEDGTAQRILEHYRVPYTGSGPLPSAIALNKYQTKERLRNLGVRMPKHLRLTRDGVTDVARTANSIGKLFGPNYFIKPERGGSSIGTYLAKSEAELSTLLQTVFAHHEAVLVEERIYGREATVGVLEQFRDQELYVLPPVEIIPPSDADFFTQEAKYSGKTDERCPGNFSRTEKDKLSAIAHTVHSALDLRHYSRSDFIVAADGIYFLEVNTLPGLTNESLFPKAIEAVGASYFDLLSHLITLAQTTRR